MDEASAERKFIGCNRCEEQEIKCSHLTATGAPDDHKSCTEAGDTVHQCLNEGRHPDQDATSIDTIKSIAHNQNITLPAAVADDQSIAGEALGQVSTHQGPLSDLPQSTTQGDPVPPKNGDTRTISTESKVQEGHRALDDHDSLHYLGQSSSILFAFRVNAMVEELRAAEKIAEPKPDRADLSANFSESCEASQSKTLDPVHQEENETPSGSQKSKGVDETGMGSKSQGFQGFPLVPGISNDSTVADRARKTLLETLPPREDADEFVKQYFALVHPNFPLFDFDTFWMEYSKIWSCPDVLLQDAEPGWISVIFMMLMFGAQVSTNRDTAEVDQIQHQYLPLIYLRMHQLLRSTTLVTVQAILLLQHYQHNNLDRNEAFILLGCACRIAMSLGMHRSTPGQKFEGKEREIRKRVWWTAYLLEQHQCAILGRPCAIVDAEIDVEYPDELELDGESTLPSGYIEYSVRLAKLMSGIRCQIYATIPSSLSREDLQGRMDRQNCIVKVAEEYLSKLISWLESLPNSLQLKYTERSPRHHRAAVLLHIQFYYARVLATRPWVLAKFRIRVAQKSKKLPGLQRPDTTIAELSHICITMAEEIANHVYTLSKEGLFSITWLDAYYASHSIFILAADFLARPRDDIESIEDRGRKEVMHNIISALIQVRLCPTYAGLMEGSRGFVKSVGVFGIRPREFGSNKDEPDYSYNQNLNMEEYPQNIASLQAHDSYGYVPSGQQPGFQNHPNSSSQQENTSNYLYDVYDLLYGSQPQFTANPPITYVRIYSEYPPGFSQDANQAPPPPQESANTSLGAFSTSLGQLSGPPQAATSNMALRAVTPYQASNQLAGPPPVNDSSIAASSYPLSGLSLSSTGNMPWGAVNTAHLPDGLQPANDGNTTIPSYSRSGLPLVNTTNISWGANHASPYQPDDPPLIGMNNMAWGAVNIPYQLSTSPSEDNGSIPLAALETSFNQLNSPTLASLNNTPLGAIDNSPETKRRRTMQ